jgi:arsenate reductase
LITDHTKILVLCTGNSCRSQMAEGFFRHYLNQRELNRAAASVRSAGLETHGLNPRAVRVMGEIGIDISGHASNDLQEYLGDSFDYVITVCDNAAKNCPVFPGPARKLHWPFDDPAGATGNDDEILDEFRRVRDQIRRQVESWLDSDL